MERMALSISVSQARKLAGFVRARGFVVHDGEDGTWTDAPGFAGGIGDYAFRAFGAVIVSSEFSGASNPMRRVLDGSGSISSRIASTIS